ncbi:hypothetical protein HN371_16450 [Candidatus Poribacteria bacterium]|jgi:hypothetical protein|nr:hypothetical protein [Candidatus Poribacteria bacterium]MBT5533763.1 hypothetical protein [Candidatus Poribacteria bacterium]MBT5711496.1 hypothetical protein [Candidatus Poribacteria bacterium]MBT7100622.1 hypothetical protein [Candidatus Poribacteria bacterium]MBT7806945.1 hypothetical protein [Candidatus Poribacteria bacterium]
MMRTRYIAVAVGALVVGSLLVSDARAQRDFVYEARQVSALKIDGVFNEWFDAQVIVFDQLKDVGADLPDADDFSGTAMIGWNAGDPDRVYFAVDVTDDELEDSHPAGDAWWEDDSMEFMFDVENSMVRDGLQQFTLGANGKDMSAEATIDNTEWILVNEGDRYIYEVAIDIASTAVGKNFHAEDGLLVGHAIHANECEGGARTHQIGWTPGGAWDALAYGDLVFSEESLGVDPKGKLVTAWAAMKR